MGHDYGVDETDALDAGLESRGLALGDGVGVSRA